MHMKRAKQFSITDSIIHLETAFTSIGTLNHTKQIQVQLQLEGVQDVPVTARRLRSHKTPEIIQYVVARVRDIRVISRPRSSNSWSLSSETKRISLNPDHDHLTKLKAKRENEATEQWIGTRVYLQNAYYTGVVYVRSSTLNLEPQLLCDKAPPPYDESILVNGYIWLTFKSFLWREPKIRSFEELLEKAENVARIKNQSNVFNSIMQREIS